jgi:hypothetical protein
MIGTQENSNQKSELLTLSAAHALLLEQGYGMSTRFGHVHATTEANEELHVCLVSELAGIGPSRFLACLEEAKKQTLPYVLEQIRREKMKLAEAEMVGM